MTMSKNITQQNQSNIWGKQTTSAPGSTLEPQRSDLFLVDLSSAARLMTQIAVNNIWLNYIPQFVRSISFPDVKLRADSFRRNSIPYNMPSWDEPVGELKITFLADTWDDTNRSDVCDLLDVWIALSRAGRGARTNGYATNNDAGYFLLDATYKVSSRFDINVSLIRGVIPAAQITQSAQAINALNATIAASGSVDMVEHTKWIARKAWCAGYKLMDLSYADNQFMTVEASFYPETIERDDQGNNSEDSMTGSPVAQTGAPSPTTS